MLETDRVGYWASRVMANFQKACREAQEALGITDEQALVLSVLDQEGPLDHSEVEGALAQFWRLDVLEWETAVGELIARGLVEFQKGKLAVTESGHHIRTLEEESISKSRDEICAGLTSDEYVQTVQLLKKLALGAERYLDKKESQATAGALSAS